jgi:hypothetical protein
MIMSLNLRHCYQNLLHQRNCSQCADLCWVSNKRRVSVMELDGPKPWTELLKKIYASNLTTFRKAAKLEKYEWAQNRHQSSKDKCPLHMVTCFIDYLLQEDHQDIWQDLG